jgi:hypothetical protein
MVVDWFWFSLVLSLLLLWLLWHWPQLWPHLQTTTVAAARQRLLKPRTPADCPTCRQARATTTDRPPTRIPVTPWRERKSRRGAPKRILTQGFACPNRTCLYCLSSGLHERWVEPLLLRPDSPFWPVGSQWQTACVAVAGGSGAGLRASQKRYWRRRLVGVTYMLRCGTRAALQSVLRRLGLSGKLNTAACPALSTRTPAMAAGLTGKRWTTQELLRIALPPAEIGAD